MKRYPKPVLFNPHHPEKYFGDLSQIVLRSALEKRFALWCDRNPAVEKWVSEELIVPYISPLDGEKHRYFIDFRIWIRDKSAALKEYWVEIKPKYETLPPVPAQKPTAKARARLLEEQQTWAVNRAKWSAAEGAAASMGAKFLVVTDEDLGVDRSK